MTKDEKLNLIKEKIQAFEDLMLERMEMHLDRPLWDDQKPAYFAIKAMENLGEISRSLTQTGSKMRIIYAAADVANFMMMLADVTFGLTGSLQNDTVEEEKSTEKNED